MQGLIDAASRLLREAQYAVALTGAGISTPSGIPDFRSETSGLWTNANPFEVASLFGFRYQPRAFFEWIRPLTQKIVEASPNPAHMALARLEALGILKSVITQNIDLLHTRAGSATVHEVHGHIREMTCISCFRVYDAVPILKVFLENDPWEVPLCSACGGVLKPNVVLFGEQLPARVLLKAEQDSRQADVMLVAGSSLVVQPAADLPRLVQRHGGKLILVDLQETSYDRSADVVIHGDVADVLPRIVSQVESEM